MSALLTHVITRNYNLNSIDDAKLFPEDFYDILFWHSDSNQRDIGDIVCTCNVVPPIPNIIHLSSEFYLFYNYRIYALWLGWRSWSECCDIIFSSECYKISYWVVSLTCPLFTRLKYHHHISCRWRRSHGSIRTQSLGHVSQARQGYTTTNISGGLPQRFLWKIPHFFFGNHPLRSNISRPYTSPIVFVCFRSCPVSMCPTLEADRKFSTFSYSL